MNVLFFSLQFCFLFFVRLSFTEVTKLTVYFCSVYMLFSYVIDRLLFIIYLYLKI